MKREDDFYFPIVDCQYTIDQWLNKNYRRMCFGSSLYHSLVGLSDRGRNRDRNETQEPSPIHQLIMPRQKTRVTTLDRNLYWGVVMEPRVIEWLSLCFNWDIRTCGTMIDDSMDYFQSKPDGIIVNGIKGHEHAILEIKANAGGRIRRQLKHDDYVQCLSHMSCSNLRVAVHASWTPEAVVIRLIHYDQHLFDNKIGPLIESYSRCGEMRLEEGQLATLLEQSISTNVTLLCHHFKCPKKSSMNDPDRVYWCADPSIYLTHWNEQAIKSNINLQ